MAAMPLQGPPDELPSQRQVLDTHAGKEMRDRPPGVLSLISFPASPMPLTPKGLVFYQKGRKFAGKVFEGGDPRDLILTIPHDSANCTVALVLVMFFAYGSES